MGSTCVLCIGRPAKMSPQWLIKIYEEWQCGDSSYLATVMGHIEAWKAHAPIDCRGEGLWTTSHNCRHWSHKRGDYAPDYPDLMPRLYSHSWTWNLPIPPRALCAEGGSLPDRTRTQLRYLAFGSFPVTFVKSPLHTNEQSSSKMRQHPSWLSPKWRGERWADALHHILLWL